MIAGFDHDDPLVFDRHFRFLQESGVPVPHDQSTKSTDGYPACGCGSIKKDASFRAPFLRNTSNVETVYEHPSEVHVAGGTAGRFTSALVERCCATGTTLRRRVRRLVSHIRRRPKVHRRVEARKVLLLLVMLKNDEPGSSPDRRFGCCWHTLWRAPFMARKA